MKKRTLRDVIRAGVFGVLIGGIAGCTLGLLIAPKEGKKIRRRVAYQLDKVTNQIGSIIDQTFRPLPGSPARQTGDAIVADAKAKAQRISEDIDALLGGVRKKVAPESSPGGE